MRSSGSLIAERYRFIKTLGTGGMGTVFLAEDERLGRRVAVKRLHADSPDEMRRRLQREARLGASLNHPNLVSVFDVATYEEGVLVVMEYVEGETLGDALRDGPLPPRRAVDVIRGVAAALDDAHENGVVHRDVKPGNVLLGKGGTVKLVDLGIGTAAQENTRITRTGTVLGTPAYMAPEQIEGGDVGPAVDIYALAVLAFEALTGQKARSGRTPVEIAHKAATQPPPDVREHWENAPAEAAAVLKRGMDRDPHKRPATAGALAADLGTALSKGERGPAPGQPAAATTTRAMPRRPEAFGAPPGGRGREPVRTGYLSSASRSPIRRWIPALALFAVVGVVALIVALTAGGGSGGSSSKRAADRGAGSAKKHKAKAPKAKAPAAQSQPQSSQPAPAPAAPAPTPVEQGGPALPPQAPPDQADPARASQLNDQGYRMIQSGDAAGAIPVLRQAVALFPQGTTDINYAYALYNLGDAYLRAGQSQNAIPVLQERLKYPNQVGVVKKRLKEAQKQAAK